MNYLTLDIINNILAYNTIKKENNVRSNNFLIILKSGMLINNRIENDIIDWISIKIQNFLIKYYNELYDVNFIYDCYEYNNKNEIKILLRFYSSINNIIKDIDDIVCIQENLKIFIHPKNILDILTNEHKYINKIGVSGISDKLMKNLWWDMINKVNGYMKYNSYCINVHGIMNLHERSADFGWVNYPPSNII